MSNDDDFLANFTETAGIGSLLNELTSPEPEAVRDSVPSKEAANEGFNLFAGFGDEKSQASTHSSTPSVTKVEKWGSQLFGEAKLKVNWENSQDFYAEPSKAQVSGPKPLENIASMLFADFRQCVNWNNEAIAESELIEATRTDHSEKQKVGSVFSSFAW